MHSYLPKSDILIYRNVAFLFTKNLHCYLPFTTNLYKCVIENGFSLLGNRGFMGLLHPEGVYDDPNGQPLRKEIYQRLKYHFQFSNVTGLFDQVSSRTITYSINIYEGVLKNQINFYSINMTAIIEVKTLLT